MSIQDWLFVIGWYGGWMLVFAVAILAVFRVGRYLTSSPDGGNETRWILQG